MQRRLLSLWLPNGMITPRNSDLPDEVSLEQLALWCQSFTPLTAIDPPDGVLLDITGCAHLFGDEVGLVARLARSLPSARIAIADTASAAWAFCRYGQSKGTPIDDLPLAALRLNNPIIAKLRRLGIRHIGELARLSRGEIRAGFGADLLLRLDRIKGHAAEPLHFLQTPADWREIEHHVDPLLAADQLRDALSRLAGRLCARLDEAERGVTSLIARFHRVDARLIEDRIGFAVPTTDAAHIIKLLAGRLETIDPGFGIETIALEAETAPQALVQPELEAEPQPDFARVIDLLMAKVRLSRVMPVETHIPEHAMRRVAVTALPQSWRLPAHPRPTRLLPRPEPIEVIASVPEDPPRLIRWRGRTHRIVRTTGPERIARDWWHHEPSNSTPPDRPETERVRDYYAIEDVTGRRFWVFRAGLHGGTAAPRWFLHGLF